MLVALLFFWRNYAKIVLFSKLCFLKKLQISAKNTIIIEFVALPDERY